MISLHLSKLKKVQVPHLADVPGPSGKSKIWEKEVFGKTQHCLEGRRADIKEKGTLPRWLKLLVFAGEAEAHSAPFCSTVQFWLPATTAEL